MTVRDVLRDSTGGAAFSTSAMASSLTPQCPAPSREDGTTDCTLARAAATFAACSSYRRFRGEAHF
jgi:hypothetical protein